MVTTLYAGILALLYLALTFAIIFMRIKYRVSIGDSGNKELEKRIRAHGNFIEYVPIALILMILAEIERADVSLMHGLGIMLVLGRVLHANAFYALVPVPQGRVAGMVLTTLVILVAALICIKSYFVF